MLCFSVKLIAWSSPLCFIVLSTLFLFLNKRLFSGETKIKWSQSDKKTKKRKKIVCAWRKLTFKNLNSDFMIFGHDVAFISTTIVINSVLQSSFFIATAKLLSNYICVKYLINSYIYLRWCNFNKRVWNTALRSTLSGWLGQSSVKIWRFLKISLKFSKRLSALHTYLLHLCFSLVLFFCLFLIYSVFFFSSSENNFWLRLNCFL